VDAKHFLVNYQQVLITGSATVRKECVQGSSQKSEWNRKADSKKEDED
jgi:hypothetical protein